MMSTGNRLPYQRPQARLVKLKPDERLMACGKHPAGGGACVGKPHYS